MQTFGFSLLGSHSSELRTSKIVWNVEVNQEIAFPRILTPAQSGGKTSTCPPSAANVPRCSLSCNPHRMIAPLRHCAPRPTTDGLSEGWWGSGFSTRTPTLKTEHPQRVRASAPSVTSISISSMGCGSPNSSANWSLRRPPTRSDKGPGVDEVQHDRPVQARGHTVVPGDLSLLPGRTRSLSGAPWCRTHKQSNRSVTSARS